LPAEIESQLVDLGIQVFKWQSVSGKHAHFTFEFTHGDIKCGVRHNVSHGEAQVFTVKGKDYQGAFVSLSSVSDLQREVDKVVATIRQYAAGT
jgi:hypothetical protein